MFFRIFFSLFRTSQYTGYYRRTHHRWDAKTQEPLGLSAYQESNIQKLQIAGVVRVLDGDTIVANVNYQTVKIRLDSIDCPENGQKWGDISTYGLIKLIGGQTVYLEPHGVDQYDRTLATVFVKDSQKQEWVNVNERMVTLGHAWVMRHSFHHLPKDRQAKLNRLEKWARSKRVGLWKFDNPIPPWQWRKTTA